jgi:hypothetical protein
MQAFENQVLDAVRQRRTGASALDAFVTFVAQPRHLLAERGPARDRVASERLRAGLRMITSSPSLLAREEQIYARFTKALAAYLREETAAGPDDPEPWIAANAMVGIHRTLVQHVRTRALAGISNRRIAAEIGHQGQAALGVLRRGLGRYAIKRRG